MTARRLWHAANPGGWLVVIIMICLWQEVVTIGLFNLSYISRPTEIIDGGASLVSSGEMTTRLAHTLAVTAVAFAIAVVLGGAIGAAVGLLPGFSRWTMASFDALRTIPVVALMPVALLIWGPAAKTEVFLAAYAATWPMLVNTAGSVRAVHPRMYDVADTFCFTQMRTIRQLILPAAMPGILVGARLAVIFSLVVAILAEMLVNAQGLGWGLVQAQQALRPPQMWAYAVVCGILGYLLNAILQRATALALPGSTALSQKVW